MAEIAKGIQLALFIGPAAPRPVSREVIDALQSVEVESRAQGPSGFQLQFRLGKRSPLHTQFMLSGSSPIPIVRVVIVVTVNGLSKVLMDGVATQHQSSPAGNGAATLMITGEDLTRLMDYRELSGLPFPALPPFARAALILAKYAPLGVVPKVTPNLGSVIYNPLERIPRQQGTDLEYLNQMAARAGYTFYLEPGPTAGRSEAYWGPRLRNGQPQPALTINSDAHDTVESLNFTYDSERRTTPVAMIQEPFTKATIPIPVGEITRFGSSLAAATALSKKLQIYPHTAKLPFAEAMEAALALSSESSRAVEATGTLNVARYGKVLESRKLVGVRGAGEAHDGLYYVEHVSHTITPGQYKQSFSLSREGLKSTIRTVPA